MDVLKYDPKRGGWIGFDLDHTLATYKTGMGPTEIGEPIPLMVETARAYIAEGWDVRVFTARVCTAGAWAMFVPDIKQAIREWTQQHIGTALESTAEKDWTMVRLYDDRAVQVGAGTGVALVDHFRDSLLWHRRTMKVIHTICSEFVGNDATKIIARQLQDGLNDGRFWLNPPFPVLDAGAVGRCEYDDPATDGHCRCVVVDGKWVAQRDRHTCEFCAARDGRAVRDGEPHTRRR